MSHTEGNQNWEPARLLADTRSNDKQFAIIVLNQELKLPYQVYTQLFSNASYRVGADGGANRLYDLNTSNVPEDLSLDAVIGDLDSLHGNARMYWEEKGVPILHDPDQYSTDFMKAVALVRSKGMVDVDIVALGGLGGRVDHGLSVLHHLFMYQQEPGYPNGKVYLLSSEAITFVLQSGKHEIKVKDTGLGTHIGIIPLKEPSVITTQGLEWDVENWKTEFGGQMSTSNLVREEVVTVQTTKDVIFTIDLDFSKGKDSAI